MKLNLGCGSDVRDGYVNIDVIPRDGVTVGDVSSLSYPDGSVDEIYASDIIEHFPLDKVMGVIKEWVRVLRPGGKIFIRTPNVESVCEEFLKRARRGEISWEKLSRVMYGDQNYSTNFHYVCFSFPWLSQILQSVGMVNVKHLRNAQQNMEIEAYKEGPVVAPVPSPVLAENKPEYPLYVKIGTRTAMRHSSNGEYYRDAGRWGIKAHWQEGKLLIKGGSTHGERTDHLIGIELVECTLEEWKQDNLGYV